MGLPAHIAGYDTDMRISVFLTTDQYFGALLVGPIDQLDQFDQCGPNDKPNLSVVKTDMG